MNTGTFLHTIFDRLLNLYGPQDWWPADSPFEVMVGTILTQNTAWTNVEKAIGGLKEKCAMTPEAFLSLSVESLQEVIRPSGYFRQKSIRLQGFCRFLLESYGGGIARIGEMSTQKLREQFLSLDGIGPETADSMLLYALERPVFVVDAYTVRLCSRLGIQPGTGKYGEVQALFMDSLEPDAALFNEFHALIVSHCKERCTKRSPVCSDCPLLELCKWGFTIQDSKCTRRLP